MGKTEPAGWVGRGINRQEDDGLVSGLGQFADDFQLPGSLHCAILRSPHPHARIVRVDLSRAREMPGVAVAVSGADVREHWEPIPPTFNFPGLTVPQVYGLAVDKAVYEGEPVAAVAATDRYLAEDALEAIDVVYEVLDPIDIDEAAVDWANDTAESSALVYEDWPDNVQLRYAFAAGDVETAFAEADTVVNARIAVHRYSPMPLETRAVLAHFDPRAERLTVRLATQVPHQMRALYSKIFRLPETSVRVLTGDVGGGYGSKVQVDIDIIPILLSKLAERPVKWAETREEWMLSGPAGSRSYVHYGELALKADGSLLGLRDRLLVDCGCDSLVRAAGAGGAIVAATYGPGPYKIDAYDVKALGLLTTKSPYGAYRGLGKDIANQLIERLMDKGAAALGLDPTDLRRRNLATEFPHQVISGPLIEDGTFVECLDAVCDKMGLEKLRAEQEQARAEGRLQGVGIVSSLEPSGAAIPMSIFTGFESSTVQLHADGTVTVKSGIQPIGQGIQTAYAQVVADCLGVRPDEVRVRWGDTDAVPFGLGSYASRGAIFGASAAHKAAMEVRRKMAIAAGVLLEASPDDIEFADSMARVKGTPGAEMSIAALAWATYFEPGAPALLHGVSEPSLEATAVYTSPAVSWTPDELGRLRLYPAHSSGAIGCLVEVDVDTGEVEIKKVWAVHNSGRIINPAIVENQVIGSGVQAIGGTMLEQIVYDADGKLLTRTLGDYQLPTIATIPDFDVSHIETPSESGLLGAKGVGEGLHIGLGAAILSAVEDALRPLGVEVLETPLTPPRILELLEDAAQGGADVEHRGGSSPGVKARSR
jgi:carbon-monoxide dehydrogenase large subunit